MNQIPKIPSAKEFCLNTPLFEEFPYDDNGFYSLEYFEGTLDFHCPGCGQHSVFKIRKNKYNNIPYYLNYVFSLSFHCSRDESHQALFIFRAHDGVLQKIGQYPSLADLVLPDLKKYLPILGKKQHRELSRAIGLTTHGVGVGAFVYLRRIFESLIDRAHQRAKNNSNWNEDSFNKSRMVEKISILKDHLPKFLVDNRSLYGILSVGVHELSEEECLNAFPAVHLAIELILDDLLEEHERTEKLKSAASSLASLENSKQNNG